MQELSSKQESPSDYASPYVAPSAPEAPNHSPLKATYAPESVKTVLDPSLAANMRKRDSSERDPYILDDDDPRRPRHLQPAKKPRIESRPSQLNMELSNSVAAPPHILRVS